MVNLHVGFGLSETDYPEYETVRLILGGIEKILEYQFFSKLNHWTDLENIEIDIIYHSKGSYCDIVKKNANYFVSRPPPFILDEISITEGRKTSNNTRYALHKIYDCFQFRDLAQAEVEVKKGVPFVFPVYDINKIPEKRIQEVRDEILELYYLGLKEIGENTGANQGVLDRAYEATKCEPWFVEKTIGDIIYSRGKNPSRAQLFARWIPDYVYHYARLFKEDGSWEDMLFMVYWRMVGSRLLENPGHLSWVDKSTLKFIPKNRSDYRIAFKVDKGPIDFSYYYDEPQRRAGRFYSHVADLAELGGSNIVRMNF